MTIFRVYFDHAHWGTVVVRASSEDEALELGRNVSASYTDRTDGVTVEALDPDGPAGVLVEDWS